MAFEEQVRQHEQRLNRLDECVGSMKADLNKLVGATATTETLVKYVILPLIVIVAGLVGIKLVLP